MTCPIRTISPFFYYVKKAFQRHLALLPLAGISFWKIFLEKTQLQLKGEEQSKVIYRSKSINYRTMIQWDVIVFLKDSLSWILTLPGL